MSVTDYRFDGHRLVVSARELWREGELLVLPRRVFDCLLYLIQHRDRAVGRDELAAAVWGRVDVSDGQVGQLVMRVRRTLGDDGQAQQMIRTLPGFGYRWILSVDETASVPAASIAAPPDAASASRSDAAPASENSTTIVPQRQKKRPAFAAMIALIATLILVLVWTGIGRWWATRDTSADGGVIVAPLVVENDAGESGWIRLGVMDLIADRLRHAGLAVPQSDHVLALLTGRSTDGMPAAEQLAALPAEAGVFRVVQGLAQRDAEGWRVVLEAASRDGARHQQTADDPDILRAARLATDRLLAALGRTPPDDALVDAALDERLRRAQAALLANELDAARRILMADPDARNHPEIRYRLALIDFRAGDLQAAGRAYDALIDGPDATDDPLLRSRVLRSRGTLNIRRGDDAAAESDFDAAATLQADRHAPGEQGWALNGRAVARLILGRVDDAAADLSRARILLEQAGDVRGVVSVDNNLGLVELTRQRPAQAVTHSGAAALQFEALGAVNEALSAQSVTIEAHLSLLQWDEALAVSDRGMALRARVDDPDVDLALILNRLRILMGLGRYAEAGNELQDIDRRYADASDWNRAEMHAVLAEWAWRHDDWSGTETHARQSLQLQPSNPDSGREAFAALLLERARMKLAPAAGQPLSDDGHDESDALNAALPHRALARAEQAAHAHDRVAADDHYRTALALAEARGLPDEIALVATSYGEWLLEHDDVDRATTVIGRIAPWSNRDFRCALLQVALFHRQGGAGAWRRALAQAQRLAGERDIPAHWRQAPEI